MIHGTFEKPLNLKEYNLTPSLFISIFAVLTSLLAIFITVIYRKNDARPWLVIKEFRIKEENEGIRIIAVAHNSSRSPALDVNYQFSIGDHSSGFNKDSSAIFPDSEIYMHMPKVSGWKPESDSVLIFEVRYKDIYGNSYTLKQKIKRPSFLLEYTSEPKRELRNFWLKI